MKVGHGALWFAGAVFVIVCSAAILIASSGFPAASSPPKLRRGPAYRQYSRRDLGYVSEHQNRVPVPGKYPGVPARRKIKSLTAGASQPKEP
jgi:hypothetical protein